MKKLLCIACCGIFFILSGCGSVTATKWGSDALQDEQLVHEISAKPSSMEEVYLAFGQPFDVLPLDNDGQEWVYIFLTRTVSAKSLIPFGGLFAGGYIFTGSKVDIFFSKNGKLEKLETVPIKQFMNQWSMGVDFDAPEEKARENRVKTALEKLGIPFEQNKHKELSGVINFKVFSQPVGKQESK